MSNKHKVQCLVCEYLTVHIRGDYEICPVCFWEDDLLSNDPDEVEGGPNGDLSLNMARTNFLELGAVSIDYLQHVRAPYPNEIQKGLPGVNDIGERQQETRKKYLDKDVKA